MDELAAKVAREYSLRRGWEPEDWESPHITNRDDIISDMRAALEAALGDMVRDAERYRFIASDHSAAREEELDAAMIAANSDTREGREGGA